MAKATKHTLASEFKRSDSPLKHMQNIPKNQNKSRAFVT